MGTLRMRLGLIASAVVLVSCGGQSATSPTSPSPAGPSSADTSAAQAQHAQEQAQYAQWYATIEQDRALVQRDELRWAKLESSGPTHAQEGALAGRLAGDFRTIQDHASVEVPACAQKAKADYLSAAGLLENAFATIARDTASMTQYGADYDRALSDLPTYEQMLDTALADAATACP